MSSAKYLLMNATMNNGKTHAPYIFTRSFVNFSNYAFFYTMHIYHHQLWCILDDFTSGCIEWVFYQRLKIFLPVVVPCRLLIEAKFSANSNSALTPVIHNDNWTGFVTSVHLSRTKDNHSQLFVLFFNWWLTLLPLFQLWSNYSCRKTTSFLYLWCTTWWFEICIHCGMAKYS